MILPKLATEKRGTSGIYKYTTRDMVQTFLGYDHQRRISDGAFYDLINLTTDKYPILMTRNNRGYYTSTNSTHICGMCDNDGLAYIADDGFYYNGVRKSTTYKANEGQKYTLVPFGAYIVCFDDVTHSNDFIYNTTSNTFQKIDKSYSQSNVDWAIYDSTYTAITPTISGTAPSSPSANDYWLDTINKELKRYNAASGTWVSQALWYCGVEVSSSFDFEEGESLFFGEQVSVPVPTDDALNIYHIKTGTAPDTKDVFFRAWWNKTTTTHSGDLVLQRKHPAMDYFVAFNNRIWGCSTDGHEIYACALGDALQWNSFEGLASDSYAVTVGSDGAFTGACVYNSRIYFFKDNCYHKIYGTMPSNFQTTEMRCDGVADGSDQSIVTVGGYLYYLSPRGVCRFDGSLPIYIGESLGEDNKWTHGMANALDGRYYLSVHDKDYNTRLLVYDTNKKTWYTEDCENITYQDDPYTCQYSHITNIGGSLVGVRCVCPEFQSTASVYSNVITKIAGDDISGYTLEGNVKFLAESGDLGLSLSDEKTVTDITIRMKLDEGTAIRDAAYVKVYTSYDGGEYQCEGEFYGSKLQSYDIPIKPKRCDYMRIKLEGEGNVEIYSIAKTITQGSNK